MTVFGDGQQSRDFTYVDDIATGTAAALQPVGFDIINLGSDRPVVLMEAIRLIERLVDRTAKLDFKPRHPADALTPLGRILVRQSASYAGILRHLLRAG